MLQSLYPPVSSFNPRRCFVIMPFERKFDTVYQTMLDALGYAGLECLRADDLFSSHRITQAVWRGISEARLLVADVTGRNPNVFYELGLAHALSKKVILLTQDIHDVPFDIRDIRCLEYDPNDLHGLREKLIRYISEAIVTLPQYWEPNLLPQSDSQANVRITWVRFPKRVRVDALIEIEVYARNEGGPAGQGYFSVSFPDGVASLLIHPERETQMGFRGQHWGAGRTVLRYPIAEGFTYAENAPTWSPGNERRIVVETRAIKPGFFWFYISASCYDLTIRQWRFDPDGPDYERDQREEPVYCGVIEVT